jgi:hypothetical protein
VTELGFALGLAMLSVVVPPARAMLVLVPLGPLPSAELTLLANA